MFMRIVLIVHLHRKTFLENIRHHMKDIFEFHFLNRPKLGYDILYVENQLEDCKQYL